MEIVVSSTYDACRRLIERYERELAADPNGPKSEEYTRTVEHLRFEMQKRRVIREHLKMGGRVDD